MQRNVTDILRDWFYRLPHGYAIQPYNKMELQVLSKILTENNIDPKPIIESLDQVDQGFLNAKPVEEAPKVDMHRGQAVGVDFQFGKYAAKVEKMNGAKATENMHEIMYAVSLAYVIEEKSRVPMEPKTLDDVIKIIDEAGGKLKGISEHRNTVIQTVANLPEKYLEGNKNPKTKVYELTQPNNPILTANFFKYWKDAASAAAETYVFIKEMYAKDAGFKFKSVYRVGVRGQGGSEVADDVVEIEAEGQGKSLYISLKYGPAQFGSLSVSILLNYLYGFDIDMEGTSNKGLLSYGYANNLPLAGEGYTFAEAIDYTLRAYIKNINDWMDANPNRIGAISMDRRKKEDTKYGWKPEFRADPKTMDYDKWRAGGLETDQSYAYRYIFINVMKKADRGPATDAKRDVLNKAIDSLVKLGEGVELPTGGSKKSIGELISYLFRTDKKNPKAGYIYVAKGGSKMVSIPSHDTVLAKAKKLDPIWKEYTTGIADYLRDMEIHGNGIHLATIPLKFRFADGQWTSDLAQKGPAPTFFHPEFEEFFNAKGDEIDVV